jgi:hypothetical protein
LYYDDLITRIRAGIAANNRHFSGWCPPGTLIIRKVLAGFEGVFGWTRQRAPCEVSSQQNTPRGCRRRAGKGPSDKTALAEGGTPIKQEDGQ